MAQDTLLGFPAHTLPFRCGEFTALSIVSILDCIYASAFRASSRKHSAVGSGTK